MPGKISRREFLIKSTIFGIGTGATLSGCDLNVSISGSQQEDEAGTSSEDPLATVNEDTGRWVWAPLQFEETERGTILFYESEDDLSLLNERGFLHTNAGSQRIILERLPYNEEQRRNEWLITPAAKQQVPDWQSTEWTIDFLWPYSRELPPAAQEGSFAQGDIR